MSKLAAEARKYVGKPLSFIPIGDEIHVFRANGTAREYYTCARTPEELWQKIMTAFEADAYAKAQQLKKEEAPRTPTLSLNDIDLNL